MKNILVIFGTRPEAIKLAPLIIALRNLSGISVTVCNTEQQKELSNQTLDYFHIKADIKLDAMSCNQTLQELQPRLMRLLSNVFAEKKYDAVIVQGDTMTVFSGALSAFFHSVPVYHIEAGLRSYDLHEPFPEEALRQMVTRITDLHFAPTEIAAQNLKHENVDGSHIHVTGNTVIDALHCLPLDVQKQAQESLKKKKICINDSMVLVTVHRRENLLEIGDATRTPMRLNSILKAIKHLAETYKDHQFILPVHPNPNVRTRVYETLSEMSNVILTEPMIYPELVEVMKHAKLILTDSGGIQEEAPSFGVPLLVMRYETERMEGVHAGFSKLVGADKELIIQEAVSVLSQTYDATRIRNRENPYGDGHACDRIIQAIGHHLSL